MYLPDQKTNANTQVNSNEQNKVSENGNEEKKVVIDSKK